MIPVLKLGEFLRRKFIRCKGLTKFDAKAEKQGQVYVLIMVNMNKE